MVKKIFQCGYISYMTDANRVAYILKHIPFVGRKIHSDSARAFGIIGIACRIIWEIIKKAVFVAAAKLGAMYVRAGAEVCAVKVKCNRQYRIRTGEFICLFLYGYDMFLRLC